LEVAQTYYKNSASNALYYGRRSAVLSRHRSSEPGQSAATEGVDTSKAEEYNLGVVEVYSAQREELVQASNPDVPRGVHQSCFEDINVGWQGVS